MARGWESKSVEAQQDEARDKSSQSRPAMSPEEAARWREEESLGGQLGGVIGGIISSSSSLTAVPKLASKSVMPVQRVRVSQGVVKGLLTNRVEPTYPPVAREARIHGEVVLTAIIDRDGNIENLQLVSGHPMLAPAAINAVKQWQYKPYLLNGQAVEVETTITVNFELRG